jgi:hexosaminidase
MLLRTAKTFLLVSVLSVNLCVASSASALLARGYSTLPQPQQVNLSPDDFRFSDEWRLEVGKGVAPDSIAVEVLRNDLRSRFLFDTEKQAGGRKLIRLEIAPGSVKPGPAQDRDGDAIAAQAYRLELAPGGINILANADAGLFYGVETLVQLVKRSKGALWLPQGEILDWPDLELRQIYWDDAHHLDRLPALKHAIRQAAFFKVNGFAIKLEGHFQFRSAPALVEPHALSPAEFQELTDYGLRYHVQVIPFLDGPAHIAFILKHPEYAKLRAFPDSNYELCTTNPDSYKLLFGMFDDLLSANKGVKYFVLSTDEPYYVGLAANAQCNEAKRTRELGSVGKVLAEFITKAAGYLHDRGRTVSFWGEYPLKTGDISALPPHVVNGETYGPDYDALYKAHGIRQMIYTSTQGEENLFPNYFPLPNSRLIHNERDRSERVPAAIRQLASDSARKHSDLMGMLVAAWGDSGLHPETFWLGYAAIAGAGWNPHSPDGHEAMASFYPLYYGPDVQRVDRMYQLMSFQAQTWTDTWDRVDSTARKPIWGNSDKIYQTRRAAYDQAVPLPPVPAANLAYSGNWSRDNARRLQAAEEAFPENSELLGLLNTNLRLADRNAYSLEVFLTIAKLARHNLDLLRGFAKVDRSLAASAKAARDQKPKDAVRAVDNALTLAREIRAERNSALRDTTGVWYKTWFPREPEANGRRFLHDLDDVKDHLPDRTVDMSYLVYRELLLPMDEWYSRVQQARNSYAQANGLAIRNEPLDWKRLD